MSAPGKPASAVPKFLSFKSAPKRPANVDESQPVAIKRRRTSSPESERSRTPSHGHRKDERRRHERVKTVSRPDTAHEAERSEVPSSLISDFFTVDRKGDPQNWTYQRLHKYAIPSYRRTGYGNVLGLESRYKIDLQSSVEDKIYLIDTIRRPALHKERALLKKSRRHQSSELRISSALREDHFDAATDFVPLRSSRRPPAMEPPSPIYDDLRSLRDIRPSLQPVDEDLTIGSSDDERDSSDFDAQIRQQNAELSRQAKLDPTQLQPWLDLIAHQKYLVRSSSSGAVGPSDLSDLERRTLADLRLHIYEKASKSIPVQDKYAREILFKSMFQEAFIIWDLQKYLEKLSNVLRELPASFVLWTMYLDAAQTKSAGFRFEECKQFFLQSLQSLRGLSSTQNSASTDEIEKMYLYIILRYTTYLREAGYEELSVATWQALFEFHLFRPEQASQDGADATMQSFEIFWESEAARFGEANAKGWLNYTPDDDILPDESGRTTQQEPLSPRHPFSSFAALERRAGSDLRFPGRTTEETDSDDPFHIIFFSDIKDFLQATPAQFSRDGLVDAFLCYLGLPARTITRKTGEANARVQAWRSDPFLSSGLLKTRSCPKDKNINDRPWVEHFVPSTQTLFSQSYFPRIANNEHNSDDGGPTPDATVVFARACLAKLVESYPEDEALAEYYLAFVCHYFPDGAPKIAKMVLKRRPSSLRLYNACAMIECRLARTAKAGHIWASAIGMMKSFSPEVQQEAVLLWQSWIWIEMQRNDLQAALSHLVFFDGEVEHDAIGTFSASATLRVKKVLKEGFEHALSQGEAVLASANVECLALLAYLSQPDALQPALDVINQYCTLVQNTNSKSTHDLTLELLHQAKARIIEYHVHQKRPYKPALIRQELEASLQLFPGNTILLWIYKENEARFRIDDRVRAVLRDGMTEDSTLALVKVSFEIDQEMARFNSQVSGSTVESVRATFARVLQRRESLVRHSTALWTRWLHFEEEVMKRHFDEGRSHKPSVDQAAAQKLKEVFLGGLHYLPWAKDWILDGLELFDNGHNYDWSMGELKRLYNVLHERELRVRVEGLEDLLDDIAEDVHRLAK